MYSANLIGKQMDTEFGLYLPEYSIPAPEVQTNYKEIPFRDGAIDKTSPDGVVHYKDREWDLTFKKTGATVSASDLAALAMSVMNAIHGKAGEIIFDDDPNYKWVGRVFVTSVNCENNGLLIVNIHMITHPYKYSLADIVVVDEIQTTSDEYEGSIVSLTGGIGKSITELLVSFSPIQDLHGYSSPWPAGGGKNKLNPLATYKGCSYNAAVGTTLNPVAADKSWQDAGDDTFTISNLGSWSQACIISDPLPLGKAYVRISNVIGAIKCTVYVCNGDFKVNRVSYNRNPVPEGDTIVVNTTFTNDDTYFVVYLAGNGADASIQYPYVYSGDTAATDSFSPYSNICPISGRTGLSVYDDPKYGGTIEWNQLADNNDAPTSRSGLTITGGTDAFTIDGTAYSSGGATGWFSLDASKVLPIVDHVLYYSYRLISGTISDNSDSTFSPIIINNHSFDVIVGGETVKKLPSSLSSSVGKSDWRFASGAVFTNAKLRVQVFDLTAMFGSTIADYIYSLEQANAGAGVAWFRNLFPKDYYPYNAGEQTCVSAVNGDPYWKKDIDWTTPAGTVYGGTLDVVTGVLTVDYIKQTITSVNLWGSSNPNGTPVYLSVSGTDHDPAKLDVAKMKSNIFTYTQMGASTSPLYSYGANAGASATQTFILPSSVTTKAEADAWFEANPTECIFKLATPLTYQLTAQEVALLVGTNNIWSTGDSVSVTLSTMDKVTLVNHGKPMNPKIKVVSEGSISLLFEIDGTRYTAALSAGEYTLPDLVLFDGSTDVYEAGEGTITYTYPEVSL